MENSTISKNIEIKNYEFSKFQRIVFIFTIIIICAIGFVASDIYLPSLPAIAEYFKIEAYWAQYTMTAFLIAMAFCQVFCGALSDKFGRKKILIIFMIIFILASLGCYLSQNIYQLILFRIFQALGACAGMTIGQAIVADLFNAKDMAKILSITIPLVAFSPAIAPVVGGYIETIYNWQTNFLILAGYGVFIIILLVLPIIPASKKQIHSSEIKTFDSKTLFKIITNRKFFALAFFMKVSNASYFSFLAASPFLLKKFGYSPTVVGYAFCAASFPYMFASLLGRRLSIKKTSFQIIFIGLLLNLLGASLLIIHYFLHWEHLLALMIPVFVITIGNGLLMPFSSANAISLFPKHAGMVTGTIGSIQLTAAGIATGIIGLIENGTLLPIGLFILIIAIIAIFIFLSTFQLTKQLNGSVNI
ncbi:multidrug effflux MFS transporter [Pigmentibacter sp. JX0631]|uniref:multidrug effflux MFS transporter n=1 Tax=Pigmentibacter sp. JX0631 TaxID=2976982 RepID=UPI00246931BC|nr:multidrug effflux MFS transporter [Pigmentibacter sp. JX0631]WGL58958.1 multidrug effflux MFS transporter [Pigmentibacter sp. JX0631]